jgi:CRISPR-associated protein (TIGR02710 family)
MTDVEAKGLTILHLSDFHFKPNFQYDQDTILNELLKKISEMNKSEWQPDLILCSGDIAYSGKPSEYKSARDFLDQLLRITGVAREKLFIVPGNHDVDWDEPSPLPKVELKKDEDSDDFFESPDILKSVLKKFHGYHEFSRNYLKQAFDEDHYYFTKIVNVKGFRIGIAGLNSAWPLHKELYKKSEAFKQLLGRTPLKKTLEQLQKADLKIVIFHHPLQWLLEFEQHNVRTLLEKGADLVLNGHQFKSTMEIHHVGAERRLLYIQAGPAHGAKPWPNRVHLIRWEALGNQRTVRVYPLKFDREVNEWVLDTAIFPAKHNYIGHFGMSEKLEFPDTGKALILSVGTGTAPTEKAVENLANALAFSIQHHNPDKTFFVTSQESQKTTLPKILRRTKLQNYETITIENEGNIQQIYETLQPKFRQIKHQYNHITVDYTSGTKAMTGALTILGTIYEANTLSYITGKRKGGIVQPGTEELSIIQPYFAITEQKIKTAIQFFNQNQFNAAITILAQIEKTTTDPKITTRTKPLLNLAKTYELWDKFHHQKAFQILEKIKMEELNLNKRFLGQLLNAKELEPYHIADLINNAKRRGTEEKKYDDAVTRLYRTIELIAQHQLKRKYNIDSSAAKSTDIPEELSKKWNIIQASPKIKIGLEKAYELLDAKNHPLGKKFTQDKKLKDLLSRRNTSILAHNLKPVTQQTYTRLHQKTIEYATMTIENLKQLLKDSTFIKWTK